MPRRMITSEIWFNDKFTALPDAGRLLFIGIFSHADDDGRLKASPKYLKAHIFPYDETRTVDEVKKLLDKCADAGLIRLYSHNSHEYLDLPGWNEHQQIRKDRYHPSSIPCFGNTTVNQATTTQQPESNESNRKIAPLEVATNGKPSDNQLDDSRGRSLSQVSQVKSNIIEYNQISVDFSDVLDNELDLTRRLTDRLTDFKKIGGGQWNKNFVMANIIRKLWTQAGKKFDGAIFTCVYEELDKYPIEVMASALAKAVKYTEGKKHPSNYIRTILKEKSESQKES